MATDVDIIIFDEPTKGVDVGAKAEIYRLMEGLVEEGLQGVGSKTAEKMLKDSYSLNNANQTMGYANSFIKSMSEQYGTEEGLKEVYLGMLIGAMTGSATNLLTARTLADGNFKVLDERAKGIENQLLKGGSYSADNMMQKLLSANRTVANKRDEQKAIQEGDSAKDAKTRNDKYSDARSAYIQAILNTVRAEKGTNRSISPEDLGHFAEDPSIFVKVGNQWALKSGWKPTASALRYARSQAKVGSESVDKGVNQSKDELIDTLIGTKMDPKRAVAIVNRAIPWGKFYDPIGAFDKSSDEAVGGAVTRSGGALSEDPSWMTQ